MIEQPSKYQLDVFDFVKNGSGNAVVNAVAGSGKTTTIVESLSMINPKYSIDFIAFNKAIVEELKKKVPSYVNVKTFHSKGLGCIKATFANMKLDKGKFYKHAQNNLDEYIKENFSKKEANIVLNEYRDFVDTLRNNGIVLPTRLTKKKIIAIIEELTKTVNGFEYEYIETFEDYTRALHLLRDMTDDTDVFDFLDMIYLPIAKEEIRKSIIPSDIVYLDEAQDCNITQQKFLDLIVKPVTGRFIAVGDPNQAIYGFAGADINSFNKLKSRPNTLTLPLSTCYRCGKSQVKYANAFVPIIEAFEKNEEGILTDGNVDDAISGDLVLSRLNRNLVSQFFKFLAQRKKAFIKGKDIGENLTKLIIKSDAKDVKEFEVFLSKELNKIKLKLEIKAGRLISEEQFQDSTEYQHFIEKGDCIKQIYSFYQKELKSFQDLIEKIEDIFKDKGDGITLSTVHKAKGLENDRVYIMEAWQFPAFFAKEKHELEQEQNLYYVAITRAKKELIIQNDKFERNVYRMLVNGQFDKIKDYFESHDDNIDDLFFYADYLNYKFNFVDKMAPKLYIKKYYSGYIKFNELIQKQQKVIADAH